MKQGLIETVVGFVVLFVAATFFLFTYNNSSYSRVAKTYSLVSSFQNIEGIAKGADVKLAGIKIGYVDNLILEDNTYYAVLTMRINDGVNIPKDSSAIVSTSGLLGGKYIRINPGASEENLAEGGKIKFTQSALNLEDLIGNLMYSITSK